MIEIKGVYKVLEDREILKDINLKVEKGSIFGLIGHNGAGKTTLVKCLTGIYKADKGEIKIKGEEIFENVNIKQNIGYVADVNNYLQTFKVKDIVRFYELSYKNFNRERFNKLNKVFGIPEDRVHRKLSKGMKTRLSIMLNLSIMPEILIMDEPTSGLDPLIKKAVMKIFLEDAAERGTTIFISSHNLSDLERICDSVAIMGEGEIKYFNSIENMKKNIRKFQVAFKEDVPENLREWEGVINLSKVGRVYNVVVNNYVKQFKEKLKKYDLLFEEEIDLSLEDMFVYSVGGDLGYEEIFK